MTPSCGTLPEGDAARTHRRRRPGSGLSASPTRERAPSGPRSPAEGPPPRRRGAQADRQGLTSGGTGPAGTWSCPDAFTDRHGVRHPLDPAHRDRAEARLADAARPGRGRGAPDRRADPGPRGGRADDRADVRRAFVRATTRPAAHGPDPRGRLLRRRDRLPAGRRSTGRRSRPRTSRATTSSSGRRNAEEAITRQHGELAALRERARVAGGAPEGAVRFVEDDITASTLEPGTFDADRLVRGPGARRRPPRVRVDGADCCGRVASATTTTTRSSPSTAATRCAPWTSRGATRDSTPTTWSATCTRSARRRPPRPCASTARTSTA